MKRSSTGRKGLILTCEKSSWESNTIRPFFIETISGSPGLAGKLETVYWIDISKLAPASGCSGIVDQVYPELGLSRPTRSAAASKEAIMKSRRIVWSLPPRWVLIHRPSEKAKSAHDTRGIPVRNSLRSFGNRTRYEVGLAFIASRHASQNSSLINS